VRQRSWRRVGRRETKQWRLSWHRLAGPFSRQWRAKLNASGRRGRSPVRIVDYGRSNDRFLGLFSRRLVGRRGAGWSLLGRHGAARRLLTPSIRSRLLGVRVDRDSRVVLVGLHQCRLGRLRCIVFRVRHRPTRLASPFW
jgi:hypothetical protein